MVTSPRSTGVDGLLVDDPELMAKNLIKFMILNFDRQLKYQDIIIFGIFILSIIFGVIIRFKGLGRWPISNSDEYFMAKSVGQILTNGFPKFDTGGYYVRGIIQQYLSSILIISGLKAEFALRLITVVSNLLAMPPLYLIGKRVSGTTVAVGTLTLFSLSVWTIEISRFARMYAPFQALFIWYFYFLFKYYIDRDNRSIKWIYILSVVGNFIAEIGVFLAILNFLIILTNLDQGSKKRNRKKVLICLSILAFSIFYVAILDLRNYGISDPYPPGLERISKGVIPIDLPFILLKTLHINKWLVSFCIFNVLACIYFIRFYKDDTISKYAKFGVLLILTCAAFNLFAMILYIILLMHFSGLYCMKDWGRLKVSNSKLFYLGLFICFTYLIFWANYLLFNEGWTHLIKNFTIEAKFRKILISLIDYPFIYDKIVDKYFSVYPIFISMSFGLCLVLFTNSMLNDYKDNIGINFLFFILVINLLLVGVVHAPYKATRYSFYLFPIVLLLIANSMKLIADIISRYTLNRKVVFSICLTSFLLFSEDFNIDHLINIDSERIYFRTKYGAYSRLSQHYYSHHDILTPAEIINSNIDDDDIIISVQLLEMDYYLKRLDYVFRDVRKTDTFLSTSRNKGRTELWSNADLIYHADDFIRMIENSAHTIWIILSVKKVNDKSDISYLISRDYKDSLFYTSVDNSIEVYKIESSNRMIEPFGKASKSIEQNIWFSKLMK